jgi:hypothetical protein
MTKIINNENIAMRLNALKSLTQQFGILHELQTAQLKLWPFAIDPNLDKTEAEVDFESNLIIFKWQSAKFSKIDQKYKQRLHKLLISVRYLLGDNWQIHILLNNELIFQSEKYDQPSVQQPIPRSRRPKHRKCVRKHR